MSDQLSYAIQPNSSFNNRSPDENLTQQVAAPYRVDPYQYFWNSLYDYSDPNFFSDRNDNAPFLIRDVGIYESKAAKNARVIGQIAIMVLGSLAGLLLLVGVLRRRDIRRTDLGLCLACLSQICILNTIIIGRWSLEIQSAGDSNSTYVIGNNCMFLQMLVLFLRITLPLVLSCLFVMGILTYVYPDRLNQKSSQMILRVALFAAHVIPLGFAIVLHQVLSELSDNHYGCSMFFRPTPKRMVAFFYNNFSMVVMATWSVVLVAFCLKNCGKPCNPVRKSRFISCCACAVVFVVLFVFPVCVRNFRWFRYWQITNLLELATPGMMCFLWLLICKDIRQYAFCKKRPEGEHCCEIKVNLNCQL